MEEQIVAFYHWLEQKYEDYYYDGYPEEASAISAVMREMEKRFTTLI